MSLSPKPFENLSTILSDTIKNEIDKAVDEAIEQSTESVKFALRKKVAGLSLQIFNQINMYHRENELCIIIKDETKHE
jgi:hypothetical protein